MPPRPKSEWRSFQDYPWRGVEFHLLNMVGELIWWISRLFSWTSRGIGWMSTTIIFKVCEPIWIRKGDLVVRYERCRRSV